MWPQRLTSTQFQNNYDLYSKLKLSGGVLYSKLDLSHTYQQVVLSEESHKLTTITTLKGLFAYYGVSSAPGIFQGAMEQLVQGIPMAVYVNCS